MTSATNPIEELITRKNPFAGHIVVRPQQIWGKSFPDVPSVNVHASNAVFDAVAKVRQGQRETVGITITAEKGLGKSHIISRIRKQLQAEDDTLFVYMSKYDNLNQLKYQFLQSVAASLRVIDNQNIMQWQKIATALINESQSKNHTPQQYIQSFPAWLSQYSHKIVDTLTQYVLQKKPEITNPYIIRAIIWTLSPVHNSYANYWLSGLELTQTQAEEMGLPSPKTEDREAEALTNIRQILDIISDYCIPVICFDELDTTEVNEMGFSTAQLVAGMTKDLYNNLKRGVLLLAMYPNTWNEQIRALPQVEAVIDRLVSEQSNRQPITLNYLNSDDVVAIVKQWLQDFYQDNKVVPPHLLYPFQENKLREFGKSKPTVRSVLKWCADNFAISEEKTVPVPPNRVDIYFQNELKSLETNIDFLMEDEVVIYNALYLAFISLIGKTLEDITIDNVEEVKAGAAEQYIDFKVVCNKGNIKIGVDVIQQSGSKYIGAALKRLIDYKKFDLTRGCIIRSKTISPTARVARECLQKLLKEQGGEWVMLQREDIKPLLAISSVYYVYACESYELTKEEIFDYIEKNKLAFNNPLIREILSDPSGQEPDNLTNDELPIRIPQTNQNLLDEIDLELVAK